MLFWGTASLLLPPCHGRCKSTYAIVLRPEDLGAMQSRPPVDLDAANQAVQEQMGSQAWDLAEIERTKLAQVGGHNMLGASHRPADQAHVRFAAQTWQSGAS